MLQTFFKLVKFFWDAAAEYADTEDGHAQLEEVLTDIENAGFDIPFWEPEQEAGDQAAPSDVEQYDPASRKRGG